MPDAVARITDVPIDIAALQQEVRSRTSGALVTFEGVVRDHDHGESVASLDYSAHPDAEGMLREICERAAEATGCDIAAVHRIGHLEIGDVALVAVVASAHRREAFAACGALVDEIKRSVPIWKHQRFADGSTEWVGV